MIMAASLLAALLAATTARAQSGPFIWDQPSPEIQLAQDDTVIPLGMGAILVPSMTDPALEPPVILVDTEQGVQDIPTGSRVIVPPGSYTIIMSTSTPGQGTSQTVEVLDAETTLVPISWGALRIEVTDGRRVPHRGGYELIRSDTREVVGTGFGADTLQGEAILTWLLPPGVYRIVKVGSNYRALRDFASVYVPEAGFVRYRLVADPNTGDFLGSGVLLPDDFGTQKTLDTPFFSSLILGADGAFSQQSNVIGLPNQSVVSGNMFLDGQFAYKRQEHTVSVLTQIEAGATQIRPTSSQPLPFVKARDRLRGDLLYTWFAKERVGPYSRVSAESQAFSTNLLATQDTTYRRQYADGTVVDEPVEAGDTFHIADAFKPSIVREGAGLNWRLSTNRWYQLNFRAGLGLRQNAFGGAWVPNDDPSTSQLEYLEVNSFNNTGFESTIVATVKLPGWATYATNIEFFYDVVQLQPTIEWRNTLSLRLNRNFSVNYFVNVDYLPQVVDRVQLDQSVLLRASFSLL